MKKLPVYIPHTTFVMRSPLFSMEYLKKPEIGLDYPAFREALLLASPDLYKIYDQSDKEKITGKERLSILKYYLRTCTRCTPFGLFAGCSTGSLGETTRLEPVQISENKRCTRLDMQYLCALIRKIEETPAVRKQLLFYPNDTIYEIGGKLRYVEYHYIKTSRIHEIASVEISDYLLSALKLAENGSTLEILAQSLTDEDIELDEALDFVNELIDSQLLKSELDPSVVGEDVLTSTITKLSKLERVEILHDLQRIQALLNEIDSKSLGDSVEDYNKIIGILKPFGIELEERFLFQTDMFKPLYKGTVSEKTIKDINSVVKFLGQMGQIYLNPQIEEFKRIFYERYEEEEVPLTVALDTELGIGYPVAYESNDINPLLDNVVLPGQPGHERIEGSPFDVVLLKKYIAAIQASQSTVYVEESDFKDYAQNIPEEQYFPETISAMCSIVSETVDDRLIYFKHASGSSAANLLGRFCHLDETILDLVNDIAFREKQIDGDKIIAEISHLPESRIGNIASRPLFRDYILHYLSNVDDRSKENIAVSDLMISIKENKVFLRSKKYNREVMPVLTCAHNFSMTPIPIYRFLCDIQFQNTVKGFSFHVGNILSNLDYLPRVQYKNIILSRQRWILKYEDVEKCAKMPDDKKIEFISLYAEKIKLSPCVLIMEADNELFIDLKSIDCVNILLSFLQKRKSVIVEEFLYDDKNAVVKSAEGSFTNEFIFTFYRQ